MLNNLISVVKKDPKEYVMILLITMFVLSGMGVSNEIATFVDNKVIKVMLYVFALYLVKIHPVLGGVALLGVYELTRRSEMQTGSGYIPRYLPSQDKKDKQLNAMNQFPKTLEEEVVSKMVPFVNEEPLANPTFKPVLAKNYGASKL